MLRPIGEAQDGVRGELGAVVADDHARPAARGDERLELARDPQPGERCVGDQGEAFPRAVVDHGQDPEAPAIGHLVGDEVERPALVGRHRDQHRRSRAHRPLAAAAAAHGQLLLAIDAEQPLVVDHMALSPQQHVQTPIPEAPSLMGDRLHPLAQTPHHRTLMAW